MSPLELVTPGLERQAPAAPQELRERIRLVAATAPPSRHRIPWRRAVLVVVPAAVAAVVAASLLSPGETPRSDAVAPPVSERPSVVGGAEGRRAARELAPVAPSVDDTGGLSGAGVPTPDPDRAQRYSALLALRVADAEALSAATQRALTIVSSFNGYPVSVNVDAEDEGGYAQLLLRVPRADVQEAVRRLGALGTIVGANVSIDDLQGAIDETSRTISRLRIRLAALRAQPSTPALEQRIAELKGRLVTLLRQRTATAQEAALATVELRLSTPQAAATASESPFAALGTAFRWAAIGAVYVLALGAPLVALAAIVWLPARFLRRRREEQLLSQS